jgi:hypothetical protein
LKSAGLARSCVTLIAASAGTIKIAIHPRLLLIMVLTPAS